MTHSISKAVYFLLAILGTLLIGVIDYLTGVEIRVFPLYFFPLVLAACNLGKSGALTIAGLSAVVWLAAMYYGGRIYSHAYIWPINFVTQGSTFLVVALLMTNVKGALKRERSLSRVDALTGLANSRAFYEETAGILALCYRHRRPITLAYVDLDNFKRANDSLGHLHGDDLLRQAADVFRRQLRSSDVVARMGGDEFAIVLPETSAEGARAKLEQIRQQLAQSSLFQICSVTASIGAIAYSIAPAEIEPMLKAADDLMYKVKEAGKNRLLVENGQDGQNRSRIF